MPSYQCQQCRKVLSSATKTRQCGHCGGLELILKNNFNSPFIVSGGGSSRKTKTASPVSNQVSQPVRSSKGGMEATIELDDNQPLLSYARPKLGRSSPGQGNYWEMSNPLPILGWMVLVGGGMSLLGYGLYRLGTWQSSPSVQPIVQETFQSESKSPSPWQHPSQSEIDNGNLQHRLTDTSTQLSILKDQTLTDAIAATDASFSSSSTGKPLSGIATRVNGKSNEKFYYLLIRSDQSVALGKRDADGWHNKVDWQKNAAIASNSSSNHLELIAQGDQITGFLNGQKIGSFQDAEYKQGKVALVSSQATPAQATITFDNVTVTQPQTADALSPEQAVVNYYQGLLGQSDGQSLDLVDRLEVYGQKRLKTDDQQALLKVGLRYSFKNGSSFCESRLITLNFDTKEKQWILSKPQGITLQPNCKL